MFDSTATIRPLQNLRRVYCAGPLFNDAERREMVRIAEVLQQAGFETFVPHADGMEFCRVLPCLMERGYDVAEAGRLLHLAIFGLDTYQVAVGCGALVYNMNGRVPDEGGVAEMSIAWTLGKPVVIYKEDVRSAISSRDNPLVVGQTDFEVVAAMDQLGDALDACIAAHPLDRDWQTPCPPPLRAAIAAGARLWEQLESLGGREPPAIAEVILELYASRTARAPLAMQGANGHAAF